MFDDVVVLPRGKEEERDESGKGGELGFSFFNLLLLLLLLHLPSLSFQLSVSIPSQPPTEKKKTKPKQKQSRFLFSLIYPCQERKSRESGGKKHSLPPSLPLFFLVKKLAKKNLVAAAADRLDRADHLLSHRLEHRHDELLAVVKVLLDLLGELLGVVGALGQREVVLGVARVVHERDEAVLRDVEQRVVLARDVRDVAVVRGGGQLLVLLAREDVDGDEVALGVAVLAY